MNRVIKEVNLPLTKTRCEKIRWSKELFQNATQKQKELFFIYQDKLEKKILDENGEWATDWELQLWWLVHKQHHPKTKDWNTYNFTTISEQQKAWLVGHILGDLTIGARLKKNLTWAVNLKFDYKEASEPYLDHLWENYPTLRQGTLPHRRVIQSSTYIDKKGKEHCFKERCSICFKLLTQEEFKYFLEEWYEPIPQNFGIKNKARWKKVIPQNVETLIENSYKDELLAYWFIDDGAGHCRSGITLNTQNFDSESFFRLQTAFENVYDISLVSHCDRDYYRAYIQSDDVSNFVNRVKNTLLSCFHYKISEKYQYLLSKNEMD